MDTQLPRYQFKTTAYMKWLLLALLLLTQPLMAETKIETIPLKHRMADELLPHVQAVVPADSVVRAFGDKLIIKADRATIANVIELLKTIDVAQQNILISVKRSHETHSVGSGLNQRYDISVDDAGVSGGARINSWSTDNSVDKGQSFRVRGVSGYPVTINMGQSVAQKDRIAFIRRGGGVGVAENTFYLTAESGFKAFAVLLPDHLVRVDIYPFFATIDGNTGQIDRSELITTVTGPLGRWLEIGMIGDAADFKQEGLNRYSTQRVQQESVYLKVENLTQ